MFLKLKGLVHIVLLLSSHMTVRKLCFLFDSTKWGLSVFDGWWLIGDNILTMLALCLVNRDYSNIF